KPSERNNQLTKKLQDEQDVLLGLLMKYTDRHPTVSAQRAKIEEIEKQIQQTEKQNTLKNQQPGASKSPGLVDSESGTELLTSHLQALANSRVLLASREREAQSFVKNPPGYCRVFTQASTKDVTETKRAPKVIFMGVFGGAVGGGGALLLILLLILLDPKLKTPADARRVTGLPVVATLGNLNKMTPASQAQWAFRTWVSLQGKLRSSKNRGFVCGITSSSPGEGRSTWVNLLSQAASDCGYRVLTIAASREDDPFHIKPNGNHHEPETFQESESRALTHSMLNTPAQVTEQLTGENPQPMVHIPLPGWVWNLERRKQWQVALNQWKNIENVVIFVELPPATEPEAVLLAEKLPNLLWLTDCGKADASDTREQLVTLRDAHCNLVGTLLNHDLSTRSRKPFAKWMPCLLLGLVLSSAGAAQAQGPSGPNTAASVPSFQTNTSFSAALSPTQRADWQKKLTLGPGDMLNFTLFGQPELARNEVMIGPDGRVSYLQAQDIMAAGFTVDELRKKFDEELSKYYRAPNVIVTPFAYNSKKYYVLGKVMNKGVFTLDRPITVMEAVARAHGFETGTIDNQNSVDLVDLQKSFVMRQGKRLPVNLEKLFQEGDLSQNAPLEPNDYLYFASGALKEVYVLGDVNVPGPHTWTENVTVISAISARGGYTLRAYKSKVLVIRGSLNKPQTFVVDTWATLDGRATDFKLEPKDIIFVPHRPFIRAEELLDLAATAFIQSSVAAWAGGNVGPIFTKPVLPNL
ncbi:MAG: Polysaccharide export protein, partial [Verrucomicrobiales bacterium]|nr:Polysaccharide export protein [Verrucomicrobiales bacterium]